MSASPDTNPTAAAALTARTAAARLGVSEAHVGRLIAAGRLPAVRAGKAWRIDPADVAALRDAGGDVRRPAHRQRGSGATTVRITAPVAGRGGQSGRVYIGRALYQALGEPPRVALYRDPRSGAAVIAPGDHFAVTGLRQNALPRLSLGQASLDALELEPGTYSAEVRGRPGQRRIVVAPR